MSKSRRQGTHLDPEVRALLRRERATVDMELALQERETDVRMTVPMVALECYDELPEAVEVRYVTDAHALVVDLPAPESDVQLTDFE